MSDRSNFNVLLREAEHDLIRDAAELHDGGSLSRFANRAIPLACQRDFLNTLRDNYRDLVLPLYSGTPRTRIQCCFSLSTKAHSVLSACAEGFGTKSQIFRITVANVARFERTAGGIPGLPNALHLSPLVSLRVPPDLLPTREAAELAMYSVVFRLASVATSHSDRGMVERFGSDARQQWFATGPQVMALQAVPSLDTRPMQGAFEMVSALFPGVPYEDLLSWLVTFELHMQRRQVARWRTMPVPERHDDGDDD